MAVAGIAFTMYPVTDLERSVAFYSEGLGLAKTGFESPAWAEFEVAGGTFGIGNFEQVGTPGTARSLALEIADLPTYRTELSNRGVQSSEPHELPTCYISVVSDPDGNQVWLHQSRSDVHS